MNTRATWVVRSAALAGAALGLGACANPAAENALQAQRTLVGLTKADLLSCAGVPERQATADGLEFFTYTSARIASHPGAPLGYYGRPWYPGYGPAWGWGWPAGNLDHVRSYRCEATFTLRDGAVERVVYNGVQGGVGECYDIVQSCTAQSAAAAPH